jgi:hypothetical protein
MQALVILLVFICSVISAPVGKNFRLRSSGTNLPSPFAIGPAQVGPSASPSTTGLFPAETVPVQSILRSWIAPSDMTDLSSFNILDTPSGNVQVVAGVPAQVFQTGFNSLALSPWDNKSAVMQVYYPQGSINPANKIVGGANFYAVPLSLSGARNVSLEYSVFFPLDFDWVKGGKLPGLYGGHKSCSGGDSALSCFSTRLMWRENGTGELYLVSHLHYHFMFLSLMDPPAQYAPKDKQTAALCSTPPQSVCESSYGLSIARGSFSFTPGAWTDVKQTVYLNTPGQQDGAFLLEVNGKFVIDRKDVYYRDALVDVPQIVAVNNPQPHLIAQTKRVAKRLMRRSSLLNEETVPVESEPSDTSEAIGFTGLFFRSVPTVWLQNGGSFDT